MQRPAAADAIGMRVHSNGASSATQLSSAVGVQLWRDQAALVPCTHA